MKKRILPLVLLFVLFLFASCGDATHQSESATTQGANSLDSSNFKKGDESKCTSVYAIMGKPPIDTAGQGDPGGLCSGAGICSSRVSVFENAIKLEYCYDVNQPNQIKISLTISDIIAQQNAHYVTYIDGKLSYTFDADYKLSDLNVLTQLGLSTPVLIPGNTPSLSMTNDGTKVTFVMPLVI